MSLPDRPVGSLATGRLLVIEHESDAGLDLMTVPFGSRPHAASGLQVVRPYLGEAVPELSEGSAGQWAGLVVLGGAMGAWDDEAAPWLPATRRLLAAAVRRELPTLGICLGAQLLAAACGGTVERGGAGLEVGPVSVEPLPAAAQDPFFGSPVFGSPGFDARGPWQVNQYHFDAVTALPADGERIVTGRRYPNQGFRVGSAAWGVQYHPEVSAAAFAGWVASGQRSGDLPEDSCALLEAVRDGEAAQVRLAVAHAVALLEVIGG